MSIYLFIIDEWDLIPLHVCTLYLQIIFWERKWTLVVFTLSIIFLCLSSFLFLFLFFFSTFLYFTFFFFSLLFFVNILILKNMYFCEFPAIVSAHIVRDSFVFISVNVKKIFCENCYLRFFYFFVVVVWASVQSTGVNLSAI